MACLGAAMLRDAALAEVVSRLVPTDFALDAHRLVWFAMRDCLRQREPADLITVGDKLQAKGKLEQIGGPGFLVTLSESVPTAAHVGYYIDQVRAAGRKRRAIQQYEQATQRLYDGGDPDVINAEVLLALAQDAGLGGEGEGTLEEAEASEVSRLWEGRAENVLGSGIQTLDRLAPGVAAGELEMIGGEAAMGKSSLVWQKAEHAARTWGPGLVVSLEMPNEMLARRRLASATRISYTDLQRVGRWDGERVRPMTDEEKQAVSNAWAERSEVTKLIEIRTRTFTVSALLAAAMVLRGQKRLNWLIVDYAQLLEDDGAPAQDRFGNLASLVPTLKNRVAGALGVPVVLVVSLKNPGSAQKAASRVSMEQIYGGSQFRYFAAQIVLLQAAQVESSQPGWAAVTAEVVKNRNGATGDVPLWFVKPEYRFEARSEQDAPEMKQKERRDWE